MKIIPTDPGDQHPTIQQAFEAFDRANPEVFTLLERFTALAAARGRTRLGIRMLWERVRWEYYIETEDENSDFKINDHYHSRYVRKLVTVHPEWRDMFELRKLRSA